VGRSFEGGYSALYQTAYLAGGLQISTLKNKLVADGKIAFKKFYDLIMKENNIPVEILRAAAMNWPLIRDFKRNWKFYSSK
jgi:hypothetical protein